MRRISCVFLIIAGCLAGLGAQGATAWLMVLNLSGGSVDLQCGDPAVFSVEALAAGTPSRIAPVPSEQDLALYFRGVDDPAWRFFQGADGSPALQRFAPGSLHIVRIDDSGAIDCLAVERYPQTDANQSVAGDPGLASVIFANAGAAGLELLALPLASGGGGLEVKELPSQALSYLASVAPGDYQPAWLSAGVAGQSSAYALESGILYLVLAKDGPGGIGAEAGLWKAGAWR